MHLLAGLGNPGARYTDSRHNIGFLCIDAIAQRYRLMPPRTRHHGILYEGRIGDNHVLAVQPQTYMNESGICVGAIQRYFNIETEKIIAFYDEIDLPPGKARVRQGGSDAGHRGVKSLIQHCKSDFIRVRLGIGRPVSEGSRVIGHVLGRLNAAEKRWWNDYLDHLAQHIHLLLEGQSATFQNKMHSFFEASPYTLSARPVAAP